MDRRFTRILVLGFACLWFGMLVPIHQRGQIRLPGPSAAAADSPVASSAARCARGGPDAPCRLQPQSNWPAPDPARGGNDSESGGGGGGCAVCHFIAGLHAPPPVTVGPAPLGLLRVLPPARSAPAPARHTALPFHGLDPPLV